MEIIKKYISCSLIWKRSKPIFVAVILIALAGVSWSYAKTRAENAELKIKIASLEEAVKKSEEDFAKVKQEREGFMNALAEEASKNKAFAERYEKIENEYDQLRWLNTLDEQMLQKYSKVYFLNENYSPKEISPIDTKYIFNKSKPVDINDRILPFLQDMLKTALENDIEIKVVSGYRSFETQATLKSNYKITYGSGANAFSADQGYSEHQLGTAIDLTTTAVGGGLTGFQKDKAYTWLQNNAHLYGFTLSYPKDNSYYVFEPWHWRFVGIKLATKLKDEGKNFYDLDQREINTYLADIFKTSI